MVITDVDLEASGYGSL